MIRPSCSPRLRRNCGQPHGSSRAARGADASSRAYYAAFHAVSAALLSKGETYSSHAQVLGRFNKTFIHHGIFPREFTVLLTRLYENRQAGDYEAMLSVTEDEAIRDVADARRVVEAIRQFLSSQPSQ